MFRPDNVLLKDLDEGMELNVRYKDFRSYGDIIFPGSMYLSLLLEKEEKGVEIKFSKLEFNTKVVPNIRISSKYKEIGK
jgi:hypothetical protein